ncbi:SLC35F6 [Bugula neritina]|uniref:SLC35F6 n=1 Tax=Bugula neritina TaxID=10212 RepID=A0A7J7IT34_BUGNE|nr:SLC35F6 [Bugula neritina]
MSDHISISNLPSAGDLSEKVRESGFAEIVTCKVEDMAWTVYQFFLSGLMLITGSINTLSTKWADTSNGTGNPYYGEKYADLRRFDHPFLQSVGMFLGEFSCLLVFKIAFLMAKRKAESGQEVSVGLSKLIDGNQSFNPLVFWPAALCDMCGTTLMYIGLNMTDASSFQMLRGAVIVFTALLSVIFLRKIITNQMWLGILFVILGLVVVGLADFLNPGTSSKTNSDTNLVITGDLLIVMAQIITACQMVYEEKFVSHHNVAPPGCGLGRYLWFRNTEFAADTNVLHQSGKGRQLYHSRPLLQTRECPGRILPDGEQLADYSGTSWYVPL